jgi:hypothetical protein
MRNCPWRICRDQEIIMPNTFHLGQSILLVGLGLVLTLGSTMARAENASYFGRWTVSDDKPVYSAKGKLYKTFDIAPCGKDFCGVSVDDNNKCGPTLFRFLTIHATNENLTGHGLWGSVKKKLQISYAIPGSDPPYITIGLGEDDMDITGREGSMPTFEANYKAVGKATCTTN